MDESSGRGCDQWAWALSPRRPANNGPSTSLECARASAYPSLKLPRAHRWLCLGHRFGRSQELGTVVKQSVRPTLAAGARAAGECRSTEWRAMRKFGSSSTARCAASGARQAGAFDREQLQQSRVVTTSTDRRVQARAWASATASLHRRPRPIYPPAVDSGHTPSGRTGCGHSVS